MKRAALPSNQYSSGDPLNKGFNKIEAGQFIEFCVELDSQDDRMASPSDLRYIPQIDQTLWNPVPVYDSRMVVANDVNAFMQSGRTVDNKGWTKLYQEIVDRAKKTPPPGGWTPERLAKDARFNGFGPYQMAWLLYEGRGANAGSYAIAIRGTVLSATPSVVEDAVFHPVEASRFLSQYVSFGSFNDASLHSGFAHGTFSLLLDSHYGVLQALNSPRINIQPHARLYIVGHSQGAAMATLTHAFFHYAMMSATANNDVFGLYGKDFKLKSYVFAQPKPGNFVFSADFASITQTADNALVINNDIDPVPQVPLTLQDLADLNGDLPGTSPVGRIVHYVGGIGSGLRGFFGRIAEVGTKYDDKGYGDYYNYDKLKPLGSDTTASSWNFVPAGHVVMVYGTPGDPKDAFLQHHAWTYRNLIKSQL